MKNFMRMFLFLFMPKLHRMERKSNTFLNSCQSGSRYWSCGSTSSVMMYYLNGNHPLQKCHLTLIGRVTTYRLLKIRLTNSKALPSSSPILYRTS